MAFVITGTCCKDASCVEVCPAQCIHPRPGDPQFTVAHQLYIDPAACIDCGACVIECPVNAIFHESELGADQGIFSAVNAEYFRRVPTVEPVEPYDNEWPSGEVDRTNCRIAIVGAGAAGCYTAAALSDKGFLVDVFERNNRPFGLIEAGVAPDHLETKAITHYFRSVLDRKNVSLFTNCDVSDANAIAALRHSYHASVWAGGVDADRGLNLEGDSATGVISGRAFASWLNEETESLPNSFEVLGDNAVIVGMGNVALDAARALLKHDEAGKGFPDIEEVIIILRGSILRAPFSLAQLWELVQMFDLRLLIENENLNEVAFDQTVSVEDLFIHRLLIERSAEAPVRSGKKVLKVVAHSEVIELCGRDRLEEVRISTNGQIDVRTVSTQNLIVAVGQEASDENIKLVSHLLQPDRSQSNDDAMTPVYLAGWASTGGTGVIGDNKIHARQIAKSLEGHYEDGNLREPKSNRERFLRSMNFGDGRLEKNTGESR